MGSSGYAVGVILSALLLTAGEQRNRIQSAETFSEEVQGSAAATAEETQEDAVDYGVSPLSHDLSALPPMKNEVYAVWEDKIYFRQYSDEDIEDGALWADFSPAPDTEKELMCMEPDGSVVQVGTDYGCGAMFIVDARIYSQHFSEENGYQVYSCAIDGSDRVTYQAGQVLAAEGSRIICGTDRDGLSCIDTLTGQERFLVDTYARFLGADEELVFFYGYQVNEETGTDELTLYSADYEGNVSMLRMFPREEYTDIVGETYLYQYAMTAQSFRIVGDMLYFSVGSYNGNAKMYSGGPIYSMKRDGSACKVETVSYEQFFYLYDDGENRVIYYSGNEAYGEPVGDEPGRCLTLYGEAPPDVVPWPSYAGYDEPCIQGAIDAILFYPDTSGACYVLLSPEESEALAIDTHADGNYLQRISDIEYVGGRLFFTVTDLTYNPDESIGWRDSYDRGRSVCYCKELDSGNIRILYEY